MKTTVSVIAILFCCLTFLNCNQNNNDNRVATLEKELRSKDSLLALTPVEYVIAFRKKTAAPTDIVKLNIMYSYTDGTSIQETLILNSNFNEYYFHTFLKDCSKKVGTPQVAFYAIQDPTEQTPAKFSLLTANNEPRTIPIDQGPGEGVSNLTFKVKSDQTEMCASLGKKGNKFIALYSIDIN